MKKESPNKRVEKEGSKVSTKKVAFTKEEKPEEKPSKRMKIDHDEQVN